MDRFLAIDAFVRVAESQRFAEAARQRRELTTSAAGRLRVRALPGFVLGRLARVMQEFPPGSEEPIPRKRFPVRLPREYALEHDGWDHALIERGLLPEAIID